MTTKELYEKNGGTNQNGWPSINSPVFQTTQKTAYLKKPGVVLVAKPNTNIENIKTFFEGFPSEYEFTDYLKDPLKLEETMPAEALCKLAGQVCYASYGPKRSTNAEAQKYFDNIISSGHGSVLEHANFSFLFYGMSRSLTHELVRHRVGFAYSQLSQRYVSGKVLRFVEQPNFQNNDELHKLFEGRIDRSSKEYEELSIKLLDLQKVGDQMMSAESKTDLKKKVQQTSRAILPNETETVMIVTGNIRAWRHFISMRASSHSDLEIRELAFRAYLCLSEVAPMLLKDYSPVQYSDGSWGASSPYPKV